MDLNYEILKHFVMAKIIEEEKIPVYLAGAKETDYSIEKFLVLKGIVKEEDALVALASFFNVPYSDIDILDIDKSLVDKFSYDYMKRNKFVPVSMSEDKVLLIATSDIANANKISAPFIEAPYKLDFVLVTEKQINTYIDSIVAVIQTSEALVDLNNAKDDEVLKKALVFETKINLNKEEDVINNPSVRLVDSIIKEAIPFRASDIHIEPFEKVIKVRYRIDGDLQNRADVPIESYGAICARLKIMSGMNIAERRVPQDGRINIAIADKEYDLRVSCLPTIHGEKFVIRILDKSAFSYSRSELGFTENENLIVDRILSHPYGIVLLTGPTGSGKTTTLYSFLKELNKSNVNIVTVEDPVEYTMVGINQTQVNVKANMTFANALRSILRQDPNIIMIGEIRDEETAQIAIRSAITGHLVLSTLHTNDAPSALVRLVDMGVPDYLVADALVGVIAQRLVKKLCPVCKKKVKATVEEMKILGSKGPIEIYKPQGCQYCNNTGYKGRIAVHEIMYVNENMKLILSKEKSVDKIRINAEQNGMVPLLSACKELVLKGQTSIQEMMSLDDE